MSDYPEATVISISSSKLSNVSGINTITVTFCFDVEVLEYRVNVAGIGAYSGTLAGTDFGAIDIAGMYGIPGGTVFTVTLTSDEMYVEGDNRVNIYGKAMNGNWTPYDV